MTPSRNTSGAGRRSFKLSPLEGLILALIVLGVLYLITMWVGAFFSSGPERSVSAPAGTPAVLMDRALAASEKVQAQLSGLEGQVKSLKKELADARKDSGGAGSGPGLARLDKRVSALERHPSTEKLAQRLAGVQKQLKELDAHQKKLDAIEKKLAQVERQLPNNEAIAALGSRLNRVEAILKKAPAAPAAGASAADDARLRARVEALEAEQARLGRSLRSVAAPVPDPQIIARLEKLEKRLEQQPPAKVPPKVDQRLDRLAQTQKQLMVQVDRLKQAPAPEAAPAPAPKASPAPQQKHAQPAAAPGTKRLLYKVHRGDTLYGIGRRFGVDPKDIRHWNPKLQKRRYLWVGESLVVYVKEGR